ncbi:MAG TPA: membrane dipeptidase, partial [Acidobacteriota bacterium]|nr:membrane dipeptidase [Acidobacteriota bacterium]
PRNMTDEMIKALAAKGGVIQINYHIEFLDNDAAAYFRKSEPLIDELARKHPGEDSYRLAREEVGRKLGPMPNVSWERIIDHIDHAVKLVGADHVGLGSDFDGATMPEGLEDVSKLPKITEALLRKGYSESDVRKILGENTLRVLAEVESIGRSLRASAKN